MWSVCLLLSLCCLSNASICLKDRNRLGDDDPGDEIELKNADVDINNEEQNLNLIPNSNVDNNLVKTVDNNIISKNGNELDEQKLSRQEVNATDIYQNLLNNLLELLLQHAQHIYNQNLSKEVLNKQLSHKQLKKGISRSANQDTCCDAAESENCDEICSEEQHEGPEKQNEEQQKENSDENDLEKSGRILKELVLSRRFNWDKNELIVFEGSKNEEQSK